MKIDKSMKIKIAVIGLGIASVTVMVTAVLLVKKQEQGRSTVVSEESNPISSEQPQGYIHPDEIVQEAIDGIEMDTTNPEGNPILNTGTPEDYANAKLPFEQDLADEGVHLHYEEISGSTLPSNPEESELFHKEWGDEISMLTAITTNPDDIEMNYTNHFYVNTQVTKEYTGELIEFIKLYAQDKCNILNNGKFKDSKFKISCTVDYVAADNYPEGWDVYDGQELVCLTYHMVEQK